MYIDKSIAIEEKTRLKFGRTKLQLSTGDFIIPEGGTSKYSSGQDPYQGQQCAPAGSTCNGDPGCRQTDNNVRKRTDAQKRVISFGPLVASSASVMEMAS